MKSATTLKFKTIGIGMLICLLMRICVALLPGKHRFNISENRSDNVTVQLVPDGTRLYMVISGPADKEVALRTGWENINPRMISKDGQELESSYADKMALSPTTSWTTAGNGKMIVIECQFARAFSTGTDSYQFNVSLLPPAPEADAIKLLGEKSIWKGPVAKSNTVIVLSVGGAQSYR